MFHYTFKPKPPHVDADVALFEGLGVIRCPFQTVLQTRYLVFDLIFDLMVLDSDVKFWSGMNECAPL